MNVQEPSGPYESKKSSSFYEYASPEEKKKLMEDVAREANEEQRKVIGVDFGYTTQEETCHVCGGGHNELFHESVAPNKVCPALTSSETPNSWEEVETAIERIVIDYANFSGRESAHRAEFRDAVRGHILKLLSSHGAREYQRGKDAAIDFIRQDVAGNVERGYPLKEAMDGILERAALSNPTTHE